MNKSAFVHLLINFPSKISISELARLLKGVSSRIIRKEFWSQIKNKLWGDHFWSPSYCAVTAGGAPLEIIKKYIQDQNRPPTENQKKMSEVAIKRWKRNESRSAQGPQASHATGAAPLVACTSKY